MVGTPNEANLSNGSGALAAIDRHVARVEDAVTLFAAVTIFVLMFFVVIEVLGRKLFNHPIPGAIDWVEVYMAIFAFLPAAYAQRLGVHVRMELVVSKMRGRLLWGVECFAVAIAIVYCLIIIDKSWEHFLRAYIDGDSTIDVQLQTWPGKFVVPFALVLLSIRLAIQVWGYGRLFLDPAKAPVAVPVILDAAAHARAEIEEVMGKETSGRDDRPDGGTQA
ncbi:MAG: TRAP transporter small permease [Alphaproteobacteria bacterium]|nr:TRAP transporter small permease [Alphaproteobacteria bacterium]